MEDSNKSLSKFLSLVLRHKPEVLNLELDSQGWIEVDKLLSSMVNYGKSIDLQKLIEIVETNDKQRFAFNSDQTKIRANQGHSIDVSLDYERQSPPAVLFHGTATRFLASIAKEGLTRQKRHHVHLTANIATAEAVGRRYGKLALLKIDAQAMESEGLEFFLSLNGVWLTEAVPSKYIKFPED